MNKLRNNRQPANNKFKPFFKAQVSGDTLEMLVYDVIGDSWDGSGVTAKDIKQQIDNSPDCQKISVRINSGGGDVFEGVAIYNLLRAAKKPIEVCVDGVAASSASIVAMAGDTISIGSNAIIMIHNAWSLAIGNAAEMRKMADTLDTVSGSIAQTYVDKTGKSMDEIKALMDAETWMNAEDCIKNGFATGLQHEAKDEAIQMSKTFDYRNYKNVPKNLHNDTGDMCDCQCVNCLDGDCADCENGECTDPNCIDCPNQNSLDNETNLSQYEARLALHKLSCK